MRFPSYPSSVGPRLPVVLATVLTIAAVATLVVGRADALALSARKDTLDNSTFSATSKHTFQFTTQTQLTDGGGGSSFPTAGVLDNFNRSNAELNTGDWTGDLCGWGNGSPNVISNQAGSDNDTTFEDAYWDTSTFGPDSEVYLDVPTKPGNDNDIGLYLRMQQLGSSTCDGYELEYLQLSGTDEWRIFRITNRGFTQLGVTVTQELTAGDSIGFEAIGSTLKAYRKTSGTWSEVMSRTDSTYGSAGYLALEFENATGRGDNFGGGTVVTSSADMSFKLLFPTNGSGSDPFTIPSFVAGDASVTCTSCNSTTFTVSDVVEAAEEGADSDSVLVVVDASQNLPASSVVTVALGTGSTKITNPPDQATGCTLAANPSADICKITIRTSESTANPVTVADSGDVLVALILGVGVVANIAETLIFDVASVSAANCDTDFGDRADATSASTSIDFGSVPTNTFVHGCHDLTINANASGGYNVTAEESQSLLGSATSSTIDDTQCDGGASGCTEVEPDDWTSAGNNGFGLSCVNKQGTPCHTYFTSPGQGAGRCAAAPCYKQFSCQGADAVCDPGSGGESSRTTIMTGTSPIKNATARVEYRLSVGALQEADTYSNTVTYVATVTY